MTITASIAAGQRVGLLGGSFNPAHQGHIEITEAARRQLRLDQCWWLVSPGNPLKDPSIYGALDDRCALASAMAQGRPWLRVTAIEDRLGTRYTIDTLKALTTRFASTRFVWLMGADNLASFHQWRDWRGIAAAMPICVVSRPGYAQAALASPAARVLAQYRSLGKASSYAMTHCTKMARRLCRLFLL